jgi:hypothetical protein
VCGVPTRPTPSAAIEGPNGRPSPRGGFSGLISGRRRPELTINCRWPAPPCSLAPFAKARFSPARLQGQSLKQKNERSTAKIPRIQRLLVLRGRYIGAGRAPEKYLTPASGITRHPSLHRYANLFKLRPKLGKQLRLGPAPLWGHSAASTTVTHVAISAPTPNNCRSRCDK